MNKITLSAVFLISISTPSFSEEWVSLGAQFGPELDLSSVRQQDEFTYVRLRQMARNEQGVFTMGLNMAISCSRSFLFIQSGEITSDFSSKIVPMPNLSEDERMSYYPSSNDAFNNLFDFVCPQRP